MEYDLSLSKLVVEPEAEPALVPASPPLHLLSPSLSLLIKVSPDYRGGKASTWERMTDTS